MIKPSLVPKMRDKPPAPDTLAASVEKAKARTLARRHGPPIFLIRNEDGSTEWDWPFHDENERDWKWLLVDAFGTRAEAVAGAFLTHLIELCATTWDEAAEEWIPDEGELTTLLHIVSAHEPKNEAQAALAAQIAATHLLAMRVAKRVAGYSHDTKMINAYANLTRASAAQFEAMSAMKGKTRTSCQQITVKHEKHVHEHKHIHVEGGPGPEDGQHRAPMDGRACKNARGAALPRPDEVERDMPIGGGSGKARVPNARRR